MSAQVTEAHKQLVATIVEQAFRFAEGNHKITPLSQLIADSEARACAELRADRDYNHECINRLATATGTLGEKSERVVEVALSTIDQLRAEVERLTAGWDKYANMQIEMDALFARAARAEREVEEQCLLNGKGAEREASLLGKLERAEREVVALRESAHLADGTANLALVHRDAAEAELKEWSILKPWGGTPEIIHSFIKGQQNRIYAAEKAEAELHALRLICGTTDADKFSTWVDRANARAEKAEAELATERARHTALRRAVLDVLCDPEGKAVFAGTDADRAAIDLAMKEGAK